MDLPKRCADAVVHELLEFSFNSRHATEKGRGEFATERVGDNAARRELSPLTFAGPCQFGPIFPRLDGTRARRLLLAALAGLRSLSRNEGEGTAWRRLA